MAASPMGEYGRPIEARECACARTVALEENLLLSKRQPWRVGARPNPERLASGRTAATVKSCGREKTKSSQTTLHYILPASAEPNARFGPPSEKSAHSKTPSFRGLQFAKVMRQTCAVGDNSSEACHRSISPMTMSREPTMAGTSAMRQPRQSSCVTERLQKELERARARQGMELPSLTK